MIEVVLDTETTGLKVSEGHRIVEIGCIEIDNFSPTSKKFHCYINPERKVSKEALEVHGYSDEFLANKKGVDASKIEAIDKLKLGLKNNL